ncbi:hypothetical protein FDECE_8542 [Fusarium decemcellulare]|nr:hypothetical protein FDECE_8542 [Fusarium decemcellulare]
MLPIVKASAGPKVVPVLLAVGSATVVGGYVRSQLRTQSRTFDRYFSQYNTRESEAVRAKTFDGKVPDPRTSFFNVLGCTKHYEELARLTMDPISGLALACNIIDLVEKAVKCGTAVFEVYNSADGRHQFQRTVKEEVDSLASVVDHLQQHHSQLIGQSGSSKVGEVTSGIIQRCTELHAILDSCQARQPGSFRSAIIVVMRFFKRRGEIGRLQQELASSRKELDSWVAIYTHMHVERTLHSIDALGIKHSQLGTHLSSIDRNLTNLKDTAQWEQGASPTQDRTQSFRDAQEAVADGMVLQLLHFPNFGQRFQEVRDRHESTFSWMFDDPQHVRTLEPELHITLPDWLREGSGIFHIAGKPGSGKSTLMKYLCGHPSLNKLLIKWAGGKTLIFAKFFFWRMGTSQEEKSLKGLVRGLLYEILCAAPSLVKALFPQTRAKLIQGVVGCNATDLIAAEMQDAFARLIELSAAKGNTSSLKGIRICFFIDGLDEFDDGGLSETHGQLVDKISRWTVNSDGNIKICVSSRIQEPFMARLLDNQRITLDRLTKRDIRRFVRGGLEDNENFRRLGREQRRSLIHSVLEVAEGVFLAAALAVKSLLNGLDKFIPVPRLQQQVAKTPRKLETFLQQVIESISDEYSESVYLLLATVLRTYGVLLSPEERESYHSAFDDISRSPVRGMPNFDFTLSIVGCFSILAAGDLGKQINAKLEIDDLKFGNRFQGVTSDWQLHDSMKAAVVSRCNGLIEVNDKKEVRFIHRSIPEVLESHLKRLGCPHYQLGDRQVTTAMTWAFLIETKAEAIRQGPDLSLVSYLGLSAAVDIAKAPWFQNGSDAVDNCDRSGGDIPKAWLISNVPKASLLQPCKVLKTAAWNRLGKFLWKLRQMRLEEGCEEIFQILLLVGRTLSKTQWDGLNHVSPHCSSLLRDHHAQEQQSLLHVIASYGHYEFIEWTYRRNKVADPQNAISIAMAAIARTATMPVGLVLDFMGAVFRLGLTADATFPTGSHWVDQRLWDFTLVKLFDRRDPHCFSKVVELWLRNGADSRISFVLEKDDRVSCRSGTPSCFVSPDSYEDFHAM